MSASLNSVGAITLFIEDPQRSKSFYWDAFGVPVDVPTRGLTPAGESGDL